MDEEMVELFSIDATPVGESRYPVGTEVKMFSSDGNLVVKVNGEVVAKLPKSYEDQIRAEKEKKIVLGARIGDTVRVSVMIPEDEYNRRLVPQMSAEELKRARRRLRKHGLDFDGMSDDELLASNAEDIRDMDAKLFGSGLYSLGNLLSGNADVSFLINLTKAQIRQQWVLARQNELIIRELRKLNEKEGK